MKTFSAVRGATIASLVAVAVLGLSSVTHAAGNRYAFTLRGVVTDVDQGDKTVKMDVIKVDGKGKEDLEGENIEFSVGNAKTYKVVNAKDVRVTWKNLAIGQEIGMKGFAKDDDTYDANFARIHERVFSIVGLLHEYDRDDETAKVGVTSSTYKPSTYNGSNITFTFHDTGSTFYEKTTSTKIDTDQVSADDQRVKVTGVITGNNKWEIKTLINHYKGTK